MDVLALTGNEIALGAVALAFIVFSLVVSMVVPRYRPDFPGGGGLGVLMLASIVFFLGTLTAVFVFGEGHAAGEHAETAHSETTENQTVEGDESEAQTGEEEVGPEIAETEGSETEPASPATTSAGESAGEIEVEATEFEYVLDEARLTVGKYTFELRNEGKVPHDLVIEGPNLDNARTPVIGAGERAEVEATFEEGTYTLYCSVPGHEDAGMKVEIEVNA